MFDVKCLLYNSWFLLYSRDDWNSCVVLNLHLRRIYWLVEMLDAVLRMLKCSRHEDMEWETIWEGFDKKGLLRVLKLAAVLDELKKVQARLFELMKNNWLSAQNVNVAVCWNVEINMTVWKTLLGLYQCGVWVCVCGVNPSMQNITF
jgi:hypothetical protein